MSSVTNLVNIMTDPELVKKIVKTAIEVVAEDICECFKRFPVPAGITKTQAADTFIRELALRTTRHSAKANVTTQEYLKGIASSAFLVEHCDEIVAKVLELEGQTQIIVE